MGYIRHLQTHLNDPSQFSLMDEGKVQQKIGDSMHNLSNDSVFGVNSIENREQLKSTLDTKCGTKSKRKKPPTSTPTPTQGTQISYVQVGPSLCISSGHWEYVVYNREPSSSPLGSRVIVAKESIRKKERKRKPNNALQTWLLGWALVQNLFKTQCA